MLLLAVTNSSQQFTDNYFVIFIIIYYIYNFSEKLNWAFSMEP